MNTLSREDYIARLNAHMVRFLSSDEIAIAIQLARTYRARVVLRAWPEFMKTAPGGKMEKFRPWLEENVARFRDQDEEDAERPAPQAPGRPNPFDDVYARLGRRAREGRPA